MRRRLSPPVVHPAAGLLAVLAGALLLFDLALWAGVAGGFAGIARVVLALGALAVLTLALALGTVHSRTYTVGAVLATPLVLLYAFTAVVAPDDQLSYWLADIALDLFGGVALLAEVLSAVLESPERSHYALAAVGGAVVLAGVARAAWLLSRGGGSRSGR
jgi:hypothetical protein